jgi:isopentenyldiphosphate isomerase
MSLEEIIDILHSDGTLAGTTRPRSEVHRKGLWHRTVHIWVFDPRERILIQERSHTKENNPGLYDTSCAGHISAGDTSLQSAIREMAEELGITKKPGEFQYLFEATHESVLNNGLYLDNEYYDTYRTTISEAEILQIRPQPSEVERFLWFTLEEWDALLQSHPEKFVSHPRDYAYLRSLTTRTNPTPQKPLSETTFT